MRTTFYSQEIIKGHRMTFNNSIYILLTILLTACQTTTDTNQAKLPDSPNLGTRLKSKLELRPTEGLVYYQGKPFTGTSIVTNNAQITTLSQDYINGKKDGFHRLWFENGDLSYEATYAQGKLHGYSKTWWRNGNLRSESHHQKGLSHGTQKQWYKSGAKFKLRNTNQGKEEGIQQSWRENGKIYNNYEAKNGRIFGLKRASLCFQLEDEEVRYSDDVAD